MLFILSISIFLILYFLIFNSTQLKKSIIFTALISIILIPSLIYISYLSINENAIYSKNKNIFITKKNKLLTMSNPNDFNWSFSYALGIVNGEPTYSFFKYNNDGSKTQVFFPTKNTKIYTGDFDSYYESKEYQETYYFNPLLLVFMKNKTLKEKNEYKVFLPKNAILKII